MPAHVAEQAADVPAEAVACALHVAGSHLPSLHFAGSQPISLHFAGSHLTVAAVFAAPIVPQLAVEGHFAQSAATVVDTFAAFFDSCGEF